MAKVVPLDCTLYTRAEELAEVADALTELKPDEAIFFRVNKQGNVVSFGDPALLIIKATDLPFLDRPKSIYEKCGALGSIRIYWYTPEEFAKLEASGFGSRVRSLGESLVLGSGR